MYKVVQHEGYSTLHYGLTQDPKDEYLFFEIFFWEACAGKVELYGMKDSLLSKNVIDGSHMVLQAEYRIMSLDSMG